MDYPIYRPRRLRKNEAIRALIRETTLSVDDLIYPLFVTYGKGIKKEINSMPGNIQMSVDESSSAYRRRRMRWVPGHTIMTEWCRMRSGR
jgi:delta-aminolevulinic acid dehydratase/porphobilinogen synthase